MVRAYRAVQANKSLLLRELKQLRRQFNRQMHEKATTITEDENEEDQAAAAYNSCTWIPHPRTGIYFPEGHESVMKDVPENAASFKRGFWLRNSSDGVEQPDSDDDPLVSGSRFAAGLDRNSQRL